MLIYLIRHGKAAGNLSGRYIGKTDEGLCPEGRTALEAIRQRFLSGKDALPRPETVYTSALKRTRETAAVLFPDLPVCVRAGFNECDFGEFEYKNYRELSGNPSYQRWVDSGGTLPFPGGESHENFVNRSAETFSRAVEELSAGKKTAAFVVHGGTVMAVMERFAFPQNGFYAWQVKNGCGFAAELDLAAWQSGCRKLTDIRSIP
ncbi:MAG TPA: histidine phosphatase family protein [Firmicutes bacterium]|nr:histidine phosphatase family protein [Bacillota bacterium]